MPFSASTEDKELPALKHALKANGKLPLTWECGCDESLINFQEWGEGCWGTDHPHHQPLCMLADYIVDFMELPGAGGLMDEGEGEVYLEPESDQVMMKYSKCCVLYEYFPEDGLSDLYVKKDDQTLPMEELEAGESKLWTMFEIDDTLDDFLRPRHFKPEIGEANFEVISKEIRKLVEPYDAEITRCKKVEEQNPGDYFLRGFYLTGTWDPKKRVLNYQIEPDIHYVNEKAVNEIVTLFK